MPPAPALDELPDRPRLFPGVELARRIERAECRLLADGVAAARHRDPAAPVLEMALAGGLATWTAPGSPLDKVAGLGFAGPLDPDELGAVEAAFAACRTPVRVELSSLAEPAVGDLLTSRGYRLAAFENVLGMPLPAPSRVPSASAVEVRPSGADELASWLDAVVGGFAHPDAQGAGGAEIFPRDVLEAVIGDLAAADGFLRYIARIDGTPAGGASLRIFEGVAQLCGAATLPAWRRRGVQTALLAARLAAASAAGCDVAVVTTEPGSPSHQNVTRAGFQLLYVRAVLVRVV